MVYLVQFHVAEDDKSMVEFLAIQDCYIFLYIALFFESFHAFKNRSRRQVDLRCELFGGHAGVFLQCF